MDLTLHRRWYDGRDVRDPRCHLHVCGLAQSAVATEHVEPFGPYAAAAEDLVTLAGELLASRPRHIGHRGLLCLVHWIR